MRKVKLLLASVLSLMAWTGVMAQNTSDADYVAAKNAITDGATYRIKTSVGEANYYVTTTGTFTTDKTRLVTSPSPRPQEVTSVRASVLTAEQIDSPILL